MRAIVNVLKNEKPTRNANNKIYLSGIYVSFTQ